MLKAILLSLVMASCVASKPTFPTDTADERLWKQQYSDGQITWEEYQVLLKNEAERGP